MPEIDLTQIKLTLVLEENKPPMVEIESGGLTGSFPFPLTGDFFVVRPSSSVSIALAMKGVYTDTNADGLPDCDRRGNPLPDEGGGGGTTPEELAYAKFADGTYRLAGSTAAVADLFTENTDWGSFDASTAITGAGLRGSPVLTADLGATLLASGFTVVGLATYTGSTDNGIVQVEAYDSPNWSQERRFGIAFSPSADPQVIAGSVTVPAASTDIEEPYATTAKFAATFLAGSVTSSVNGGAIDTVTTESTALWNLIALYVNAEAVVTELTFYPPVPDADLPALSAL